MNDHKGYGPDFEGEAKKRDNQKHFEDKYTEVHFRTERINTPSPDGQVFEDGNTQAKIQSDSENGRLATYSHKELIRCACGCVVDSILKTRQDQSGKIFCEKHAFLFCRRCSLLITPGEQVRINDAYYHREHCAVKVIDSILSEAERNPDSISAMVRGELKAIKASIMTEKYLKDWNSLKAKVLGLLPKRKNKGVARYED